MDFSTFSLLLIHAVYYILIILITFFSIFGIYILIRYGKSPLLSLVVALFYCFIFFEILVTSYNMLNKLTGSS